MHIMRPLLSDIPHEEFWALLLNRSNRVMDKVRVSQGGVSHTITDVRLIMRPAIERLAAGIVLVHNHPSGNLEPSPEDRTVTEQVHQAARLFQMKLLDHVIISSEGFLSFVDEGLLVE